MSFRFRVLLVIGVLCLLSTVTTVFIAVNRVKTERVLALKDKSRAILSRLDSVRSYIASQGALEASIEKAREKFPDGNLSKESQLEILKQVPIFAAMKVGAENAMLEHYRFRIFSDEPRNKDNKATQSENEILHRFEADPALTEITEETPDAVTVYHPVRLSEKQGCLKCHGDPSQSPFKNGRDILGYPMEKWGDGYLHGAFAVISDLKLESVQKATTDAALSVLLWSLVGSAVSFLFAWYLMRTPLNTLNDVSRSLQQSGEKVESSSSHVAKLGEGLSDSSAKAASSLEETAAISAEISSMVRLNLESARAAQQLTHDAFKQARDGHEKMKGLMNAMGDISKGAAHMESIIAVIEDIAVQTNLLALNAAVEAARAGQQGKGFAVVAEAVQALAQKSAHSAKEISVLIHESFKQIESGRAVADQSGVALEKIVLSVEKVAAINKEIANASGEQAKGIEQISVAISQLDQVAQENASQAEQSSQSAGALIEQSQVMYGLVGNLVKVLEG